jgi:hypothetical protein
MPAVELMSTIAPPLPRSIIDGIAISTVLNTPVRLTSMTSCQAAWARAATDEDDLALEPSCHRFPSSSSGSCYMPGTGSRG